MTFLKTNHSLLMLRARLVSSWSNLIYIFGSKSVTSFFLNQTLCWNINLREISAVTVHVHVYYVIPRSSVNSWALELYRMHAQTNDKQQK